MFGQHVSFWLLRSIPQRSEVLEFNCKRRRRTRSAACFFKISAFRLLISCLLLSVVTRREDVKPHCWSWLADGLQSLSFIQIWGVVTVWRLESHQRRSQRGETSWKARWGIWSESAVSKRPWAKHCPQNGPSCPKPWFLSRLSWKLD